MVTTCTTCSSAGVTIAMHRLHHLFHLSTMDTHLSTKDTHLSISSTLSLTHTRNLETTITVVEMLTRMKIQMCGALQVQSTIARTYQSGEVTLESRFESQPHLLLPLQKRLRESSSSKRSALMTSRGSRTTLKRRQLKEVQDQEKRVHSCTTAIRMALGQTHT